MRYLGIVKDHNEKYDQTVKSRVGGIEISGLSFIGDAVKLCTRILAKETIEKKYIFLVTDGQQLGTLGNNKDMEKAVKPFADASKIANELKLGINAGHDLSLQNLFLVVFQHLSLKTRQLAARIVESLSEHKDREQC